MNQRLLPPISSPNDAAHRPCRVRALLFATAVLLCGTLLATAQSLTVSSSLSTITIHPGDSGVAVPVTVSGTGVTGPVTVTLTGLPSGITVAPLTLSAGSSGTLFLSASANAAQEIVPTYYPQTNDYFAATATLSAFSGTTQANSPIQLSLALENPSYAPSQVNLPVMTISTTLPILDKTTDIPANITITSADGKTAYLPGIAGSDGTATVHLHGNTTVLMPKKPYHLKLNMSTDLLTAMGLQCPYVTSSGKPVCDKSKSYILLANYDDKTLLRDWAASALANAIPMGGDFLSSAPGSPNPSGTSALMPWAPHSLFVELYLNGQYEGNYQLIEEVKVDSHRVNITEMDDTDSSGSALTGGYLLEIDERQDEDFTFKTLAGVYVGLEDPDFSPEVTAQTNYIQAYINQAEQALFSSDSTGPSGWRAYFDDASTVNFYIMNDLMGNVDGGAFHSSDYLYKDRNNGLLYMGPIWDFDLSTGNINSETITSPLAPWMQTHAVWYVKLFQDPSFLADVTKQWNALKNDGVLSAWMNSIPKQAATLELSQQNNNARWTMQGEMVWPNVEAGNYDAEVAYMTGWLNLRIGYLDSQFNSKQATTTLLSVSPDTLRNGSPAVLTANVSGGTNPTGVVSFLCNNVFIGAAPMDGSGNATLTTSNLPAGNDSIVAAYNSDNTNALSTSDPATETVLAPQIQSVVNLTSSTNAVQAPAPVTLTAAIAVVSGSAAPTGTISFLANGTAVASAPVSGGVATVTLTTLPSGDDAITAAYSGDQATAASNSNSVQIQVTPPPPAPTPVLSLPGGNFTDSQTVTITDSLAGAAIYYTTDGSTPTPGSTLYTAPLSINQSQQVQAIAVADSYSPSAVVSATYSIPTSFLLAGPSTTLTATQYGSASAVLTVTPQYGFQGNVGFSCSGLPVGWECSFSPSAVNITSSSPTQGTLIIGRQQSSRSERRGAAPWRWVTAPVFALVLMLPLRRKRIARLLVLLVALAVSVGLQGCADGGLVQNATVMVQATGGGVTQTVSVAVTLKS